MRQWPFFGDTARSADNKAWFADDKVAVACRGWAGRQSRLHLSGRLGFGIIKTSPNLDAARNS